MKLFSPKLAWAAAILVLSFGYPSDVWAEGAALQSLATAHPNTFFDPDPHHPWNELYGALFIRPGRDGKLHGLDEPDPLYWSSSRYLLETPLHAEAISVLDDFIRTGAAERIHDPLKRAVLQRLLWALFDHWSRPPLFMVRNESEFADERRELQRRLVKIMKAIALTKDELGRLPRSYELEESQKIYPTVFDPAKAEQPFLPGGLYAHGDWVELDGTNYDLLAPVHTQSVSGRSAFHVFLNLPGGRAATLAYLKQVHDFQPHWIYNLGSNLCSGRDRVTSKPPYLNPAIPQVPLLTKFALARTAMVITTDGDVASVPLTESVQVRVIRTIEPNNGLGGKEDFFMFKLDPAKLMAGGGGLVALGPKEAVYDLVLGGSIDSLEDAPRQQLTLGDPPPRTDGRSAPLVSCFGCHDGAGIFSMNSYVQFFQPNLYLQAPDVREGYDSAWSAVVFKREQYNWGLLQAYWFDAD